VGQVQLAPEAAAWLMREVRAPPSAPELSARETDVLSFANFQCETDRLAERGLPQRKASGNVGLLDTHLPDKAFVACDEISSPT
jgi:hypothetical protein